MLFVPIGLENVCSNSEQLANHLVYLFYVDKPSYNKNILWAIIDNHAELVKYIKVKFLTPPTATNELYKSIQLYLTYYGKLENEGYYLSGFSKTI